MADEKVKAPAICRGQTIKYDTIMRYIEVMPKTPMKKAQFDALIEKKFNGWTSTHYQPAKQAALYYEEDGTCYPRFTDDVTVKDVVDYIVGWATRYFAPNPMTKDLMKVYSGRPINIYAYLRKCISEGETNFQEACNNMFEGVDELNNIDKIKAYIIAFTNIKIDENGNMSLRDGYIDEDVEVYPQLATELTSKEYFMYFNCHPNKNITEPPTLPKDLDTKYRPFVAAIKTKPFLLLAGISGTGKSKIVRDMARACWPEGNENREKQVPDNFMMIPVRPNWHDSTELIGYVSNIPEPHYVVGPFLRAIAKAWELTAEYSKDGKTMPYFVCLDEMNLAPVEQYFAEYLSVIESRKINKGGTIETDPILKKEDNDWFPALAYGLVKDEKLRGKIDSADELDGLPLPPNLIVCGTVNMDETTYAFSRKVLDRAMTIEMNEVVLEAGLGKDAELFPNLEPESLLADRIRPEDYYEAGEHTDTIEKVLGWLGKINEKLEGTPFKIAYRTRNEILLYVIHSKEMGAEDEKEAFDEAVNMKILPRIEGDQKKVGTVLNELRQVLNDVGIKEENSSPSLKKITMMEDRLKKQYYCTYWN